ncbi:glutamate receptor 2.8-like [Typha latifolia]|uniref:glutamate receptor 2.8-like n=1 Tax=Typha latifolia TaxID=4733 RepID=UPI003C2BC3C2
MGRPTLLILLICIFSPVMVAQNASRSAKASFHVGIVLDLGTPVGKMGQSSLSMAIEDFYAIHGNYSTRLVLHSKDSNNDNIQAASAALNLLENHKVQAIIGPQKSSQAVFISDLGNKTHVPIISFSATNPSLSSSRIPYFVRTTLNDSAQVNSISSLIKAYGWREVVPIYEDSDYGRGIIPFLTDALQGIDTRVPYRSVIPLSSTNDQIKEELYKLMTMQTRVFLVHMSSSMGSLLFSNAKDVGMMSEGYAWIMTDGISNIVDSLDASIVNAMQGALGVKLYIPKSRELESFTRGWKKRFLQDNPNEEPVELSIFNLWAYDTIWALAMAVEHVGVRNAHFQKPIVARNSTDLETLAVSINGPELLKAILSSKFRGLSGDFKLIDGQLQYTTFQIINVVGKGAREIGFWTAKHGLSRQQNLSGKMYSTLMSDLNPVVWPGESTTVPKGWEIPVSSKRLQIGVRTSGYPEFIKVERDPTTNSTTVSGYAVDVFETAIKKLPYAISYEYIPFENAQGEGSGTYNDFIYQVYLQKYDAVIGDITIRYNRTLYADFTSPYTESGISMIVPVKENINKNAWIFLKPLTFNLWLGSFGFFVYTGVVIWVMEHRINTEFRGPLSHQLGTIFYFSFSTLVFAHRERLENILSKIVVIVWVFVVLILTSSYTASLTSMLTVQQLQPTVTDVHELLKNGEYIGYHNGSFVEGLLEQLNFDKSKIRAYDSPDDFLKALAKGSKNGGVAAIIHEIPYIRLFLARHCTGYTMVGPIYKTAGFGFAFPKGSPLVPDISRAILNITDGDSIIQIEKKWTGDSNLCQNEGSILSSGSLTFRSFWGLFLVTGAVSACSLLIFLTKFFYNNWHRMRTIDPDKSIWHRIFCWLKYYNEKDIDSYSVKRDTFPNRKGDNHINHKDEGEIATRVNQDTQTQLNILDDCDVNSCPPEEQEFSAELTNPSSEAQLVSTVATN